MVWLPATRQRWFGEGPLVTGSVVVPIVTAVIPVPPSVAVPVTVGVVVT